MDEERLSENFDPLFMEECNEGNDPQFNYEASRQNGAISVHQVRCSKMAKSNNLRKTPEERRKDDEEDEINDFYKLSKPANRWSYGVIGHRMQRRLRMKEPYETKLQIEMIEAKK